MGARIRLTVIWTVAEIREIDCSMVINGDGDRTE
jgi:hypothetical protein